MSGHERPLSRRDALRGLAALATVPLLDRTTHGGIMNRRDGDAQPETAGVARAALDRVGLAVYTVRGPAARDFEGTLHEVARIGYRTVDMYIYEGRLPPTDTRAVLDRAGLACRSARVATAALYRGWDRSLDAAATLGARWITLANIPWEERVAWIDWEELFDAFNRVGEAAARRGLGFCHHNHDFELQAVNGKVPLDALLAATDPALVKLQMDVYWMTKGGRDPVREIARLGARVASLHLKDMDATAERGITTVGRGTLDFAAILRAAQRAGVVDFFVEEDAPRDPLAAARESFAYLARLAP